MTRRRRFTDEECRALASWFTQLRAMGSVRGKCRELGVSKGALMDAIARGSNAPTRATREKLVGLDDGLDSSVSRETEHSGQITDDGGSR